ncbi:MAG: lipopolysaccharide biosynthesis protein [Thermoleophilia bacterium]
MIDRDHKSQESSREAGQTGLHQGRTLTKLTAHSIVWMSSATLISRLVRTLVTLVLAKLLAPSEFGLFSLALIATSAFGIFREMGLSQALIFRRRDIDRAADTAFFLVPAQGLLMFCLAFALAPAISSFFNIPEASLLIRVLSLDLVVSSFGMVPAVLLERDLRFRAKFIPLVAPVIGYSVVAVIAAIFGFGVWSLVAGELARSFLTGTVIWFFTDWRPRLFFNWQLAKDLLSYGKHIVGASLTVLLFTNIDNIAVAKELGTENLGFYVFAFSVGTMPITYIATSVNRVLFPAYSRIQTDLKALSRAYAMSVEYMGMIAAPMALATATLAPVMLTFLYGDKWKGSVAVLQILAFYGLSRGFGTGAESILKSLGKPRLVSWVTYIQFILILPLLYTVTRNWGIVGVGLLFTASISVAVFTLIFLACRACGASFIKILSGLAYPLIFSCISSLAAYLVSYQVIANKNFDSLAAGAATYILVYLLCLMAFRRHPLTEFFRLIKVGFSSTV